MKNTIYILFLVAFCSFGQVPNTNNFSLEDVKNEIENNGGFTTNNLVNAFVNATGTFDPDYVGSKDRLSNFRNYQQTSPVVVSSFTMSNTPQSVASQACNEFSTTTRWKTGSGSVPSNGQVLYTSSAGTNSFNGNNQYFRSNIYVFKVSTVGVISEVVNCQEL